MSVLCGLSHSLLKRYYNISKRHLKGAFKLLCGLLLRRVFKPEELAQDEKYHLYLVGRTVPNVYHRLVLWGHVSWSLRLMELLKPALDATDPDREMDIYVSCKVTGPAYVKGSAKENAVYVDKVVCVKRNTIDNTQHNP